MRLSYPAPWLLFALTVTSFAADNRKELGDVELDLNHLESWDTKDYALTSIALGAKIGECAGFRMKTEVFDDHLVFTDSQRLGDTTMTLRANCSRNSLLSVNSIHTKWVMRDIGQQHEGEVQILKDQGKAIVRKAMSYRDGTEIIDFPPDTVVFSALCRIVTLLPREKGSAFTFQHCTRSLRFEPVEPSGDAPLVLEGMGPESVEVGDKKVECFRFEMKGLEEGKWEFLVGEDDVLERFRTATVVYDLIHSEED